MEIVQLLQDLIVHVRGVVLVLDGQIYGVPA
jgi:hypothetical protein